MSGGEDLLGRLLRHEGLLAERLLGRRLRLRWLSRRLRLGLSRRSGLLSASLRTSTLAALVTLLSRTWCRPTGGAALLDLVLEVVLLGRVVPRERQRALGIQGGRTKRS